MDKEHERRRAQEQRDKEQEDLYRLEVAEPVPLPSSQERGRDTPAHPQLQREDAFYVSAEPESVVQCSYCGAWSSCGVDCPVGFVSKVRD